MWLFIVVWLGMVENVDGAASYDNKSHEETIRTRGCFPRGWKRNHVSSHKAPTD
jgi:hypothetical protein